VRRHPAALALATLVAIAGAVLAVQAVRARSELREQEARMRREQESLARLSSLWSSITERKREMRAGRVRPERGIAELRAAVAEVDRVPGPQARYVRARARLYLGDRRGAEEDARAVLAAMPECGPAWAMLGMILLEDHREGLYGAPPGLELRKRRMAGVMERALDAFRRAGPPPPAWGITPVREDEVLRTLASACGRFYVERDEEGARAALTAAMAEYQSEEYAEVLATWASMPESVEWHRRAIRLAPGYAKAHADLGATLAQLGDLAGARAALDEALRLDPAYVAAMANRGNVRSEQGDTGALDDYDRAIAMKPQAAGLHSMRGKYRLRRGGDLVAAAADFERAVALDPEAPEGHSGLGLAAGGRGDYRAAVEHFTRAIDLFPSYAEAYVNRASVRVQIGDLAGARADCDRAIEIEPSNPAPYLNRGSIRLTEGDAAGAAGDLERALQLAPPGWPHRGTAQTLLKRARER
jgi:tetratricopeptide (TPR) repeat protein